MQSQVQEPSVIYSTILTMQLCHLWSQVGCSTILFRCHARSGRAKRKGHTLFLTSILILQNNLLFYLSLAKLSQFSYLLFIGVWETVLENTVPSLSYQIFVDMDDIEEANEHQGERYLVISDRYIKINSILNCLLPYTLACLILKTKQNFLVAINYSPIFRCGHEVSYVPILGIESIFVWLQGL